MVQTAPIEYQMFIAKKTKKKPYSQNTFLKSALILHSIKLHWKIPSMNQVHSCSKLQVAVKLLFWHFVL